MNNTQIERQIIYKILDDYSHGETKKDSIDAVVKYIQENYVSKEELRTKKREYVKKWEDSQLSRGLCKSCNNKLSKNSKFFCKKHLIQHRKYKTQEEGGKQE